MCGRYTYFASEEVLKEFELEPNRQLQQALHFPDNFNVAPNSDMPVIIRGSQKNVLEFMTWGLIPSWSKDPAKALKLINARREGLLEKPMWRRLVKSKRCIVPARGFYEWKTVAGKKLPYYITPKDGNVFSFAGLWDEWHDDKGNEIISYSIITTNPNKEMSEIHKRMPAILDRKQAVAWMEPMNLNQDQIDSLLGPAPDGSLNVARVSTDVNSVRNNSEDLIYPLGD